MLDRMHNKIAYRNNQYFMIYVSCTSIIQQMTIEKEYSPSKVKIREVQELFYLVQDLIKMNEVCLPNSRVCRAMLKLQSY